VPTNSGTHAGVARQAGGLAHCVRAGHPDRTVLPTAAVRGAPLLRAAAARAVDAVPPLPRARRHAAGARRAGRGLRAVHLRVLAALLLHDSGGSRRLRPVLRGDLANARAEHPGEAGLGPVALRRHAPRAGRVGRGGGPAK